MIGRRWEARTPDQWIKKITCKNRFLLNQQLATSATLFCSPEQNQKASFCCCLATKLVTAFSRKFLDGCPRASHTPSRRRSGYDKLSASLRHDISSGRATGRLAPHPTCAGFALQQPFIDEALDAPLNRTIKPRQFSNSSRIPFNRPGQDAS